MNSEEALSKLASLSLRERQLYAAACLRHYCEVKHISHQAIKDLTDHLDAIATTGSLAEWDARGAVLPLNGRGDPLPNEVETILRADEKREFMELVDSVVEVGIVDLYGASTNLPLKFLNKAMRILEENRIPLPLIP